MYFYVCIRVCVCVYLCYHVFQCVRVLSHPEILHVMNDQVNSTYQNIVSIFLNLKNCQSAKSVRQTDNRTRENILYGENYGSSWRLIPTNTQISQHF